MFVLSNILRRRCTNLVQNCVPVLCVPKAVQVSAVEQVRCFPARKGTRERKLAIKRANVLKKAAKLAREGNAPKYMDKRPKRGNEANHVERVKDENWPDVLPVDDIIILKFYRGLPKPFKDAVLHLQRLHHPKVLNHPNAFVYATIELDLRMKKKNKFLDEFSGIINFPKVFEKGSRNQIIALCKDPELQIKAYNAGAVHVGEKPLIKQILSGYIAREDFDFVICHPDIYKEVAVLRGVLNKARYPNMNNGLLRLDVDNAVKTFIGATTYESHSSTAESDFGWVNVCFGRLSMELDDLEENMKHLLNTIEKHKPVGPENVSFITRTLVWSEETEQKIKIPHWAYLEGYVDPLKKKIEENDNIQKAINC